MNKNDVLVVEREGVLGVEYEDARGRSYFDTWAGTKEQLHTALASRGYRRVGAAKDSDIGGLYVRTA